jgi:hypothetical protein
MLMKGGYMRNHHFISAILIFVLLLLASSCSDQQDTNANAATPEGIKDMAGDMNTDDMDLQRTAGQQRYETSAEKAALAVDTDLYSYHFRDIYNDYFYFNEINSYYSGYRLFSGVWNPFGNTWFNVTMMYRPASACIVVCADYTSEQVFYYYLHATDTYGYYTGSFTYLTLRPGYTNRVRRMDAVFIKGSLEPQTT